MLRPGERAALFAHCHDHSVAVCPQCSESVTFDRIGTDIIGGVRDFCPQCRTDLTEALREHLANCTFIRVQARETRERAKQTREQAHKTAKQSQQLRDTADVLMREAEDAQQKARDAKRGPKPRSEGGTT